MASEFFRGQMDQFHEELIEEQLGNLDSRRKEYYDSQHYVVVDDEQQDEGDSRRA